MPLSRFPQENTTLVDFFTNNDDLTATVRNYDEQVSPAVGIPGIVCVNPNNMNGGNAILIEVWAHREVNSSVNNGIMETSLGFLSRDAAPGGSLFDQIFVNLAITAATSGLGNIISSFVGNTLNSQLAANIGSKLATFTASEYSQKVTNNVKNLTPQEINNLRAVIDDNSYFMGGFEFNAKASAGGASLNNKGRFIMYLDNDQNQIGVQAGNPTNIFAGGIQQSEIFNGPFSINQFQLYTTIRGSPGVDYNGEATTTYIRATPLMNT